MKNIKIIIKQIVCFILIAAMSTSCNDFLDKEPLSTITPSNYLEKEDQLASYINKLYPDILPSHPEWSSTFEDDKHTDNMAARKYDNRYVPGEWKTDQNDDEWRFDRIGSCNYFFENVLPKLEKNTISGNTQYINHYVGEMYFLRAYEYFKRLQKFGDYPIVENVLPDDKEALIAASKRSPRNEVARFIIADLDKALDYMAKGVNPDSRKNRISRDVVLLIKSRVALFEATWLKYFKNTAFVPNGEGWPGKSKDYNANYTYPSGSIDNEINYFLDVALVSAKEIADKIVLVENTGTIQQSPSDPINPYMDMYGTVDLKGYPSEIMMWREYNKALKVTHNVVVQAQFGYNGVGVTRGMVDGFLMSDGLPIYASPNYQGDDNMTQVRTNRDSRLSLFLKEKGQKNILFPSSEGTLAVLVEPYPDILTGLVEKSYSTGYALRKGNSYYQFHCANGLGYTASITFRGVEALLNYMEACYERKGNLDADADKYWKMIRERAKVDTDYNKTIAATDMTKEARNDWGAYSAANLISPTLYNIRRERRCELMAESLRWMDLTRWRAMDQMLTTPYHIEGFKLWGPEIQNWYAGKLVYGMDNPKANVSDPSQSLYFRPYEINSKSLVKDGYKWAMAHYLRPLPIKQLLLTTQGTDVSGSPLYQNPFWPNISNGGAVQ